MQTIQIDFDVFKAITVRRPSAAVTENDVLREVFGLPPLQGGKASTKPSRGRSKIGGWMSEGVNFPIGTTLQHRFRGGRIAAAKIVANGVEYDGQVYPGLSPAAAAASGHQANGWQFWELNTLFGWRKADSLRQ